MKKKISDIISIKRVSLGQESAKSVPDDYCDGLEEKFPILLMVAGVPYCALCPTCRQSVGNMIEKCRCGQKLSWDVEERFVYGARMAKERQCAVSEVDGWCGIEHYQNAPEMMKARNIYRHDVKGIPFFSTKKEPPEIED